MAKYTVNIETDTRFGYRFIRVRPVGHIEGLRGTGRNYRDLGAFSNDLRKYLSFTSAEINDLLESERTDKQLERVELSDMDAAYFEWRVEETKRVYIFLKAEPVTAQQSHSYTITAQSKLKDPLTAPIPIGPNALKELLKRINEEPQLHFVWNRHIQSRELFRVITVPHLWEIACSEHGIDLASWTIANLATPDPILVAVDAIRSETFTPDLERKYPARHRHVCPHCGISYELVVQLTHQGTFDTLPEPSLPAFEFLRRRIDAGHPDHAETRLRSMGTNAFPVKFFTTANPFRT